jgi:hypothetical protein
VRRSRGHLTCASTSQTLDVHSHAGADKMKRTQLEHSFLVTPRRWAAASVLAQVALVSEWRGERSQDV